MTQGNATEKIWLRDDEGNLYALTPEVLNALRVPEEHKAEAEEVISGKDDTAGFIDYASFATQGRATSSFSSLSLVGKCMCGRNFGVQNFGSFSPRIG
jgi:hypothetical protein